MALVYVILATLPCFAFLIASSEVYVSEYSYFSFIHSVNLSHLVLILESSVVDAFRVTVFMIQKH